MTDGLDMVSKDDLVVAVDSVCAVIHGPVLDFELPEYYRQATGLGVDGYNLRNKRTDRVMKKKENNSKATNMSITDQEEANHTICIIRSFLPKHSPWVLVVVFGCNIAQPVAEHRPAFARRGVLCASPWCRPVKRRDGMQVRATRRCSVDHIRHSALSRERHCAYPKFLEGLLDGRLDCGELGIQHIGCLTSSILHPTAFRSGYRSTHASRRNKRRKSE
ncbi:hypothetical protein K449DRAFT_428961 [Hypoxylon sp. EC38]|nr:hypothetical protein K449DRAFT_428961 [Hypoxylon sp. EC38]